MGAWDKLRGKLDFIGYIVVVVDFADILLRIFGIAIKAEGGGVSGTILWRDAISIFIGLVLLVVLAFLLVDNRELRKELKTAQKEAQENSSDAASWRLERATRQLRGLLGGR